jgi:hypothetical protein
MHLPKNMDVDHLRNASSKTKLNGKHNSISNNNSSYNETPFGLEDEI